MSDSYKDTYKKAREAVKDMQFNTDVISGGHQKISLPYDVNSFRLLSHYSLKPYILKEYGVFIQGCSRGSVLLEIGYIGLNNLNEIYRFRVTEGIAQGDKNMFIPENSLLIVSIINENALLEIDEIHLTANIAYN